MQINATNAIQAPAPLDKKHAELKKATQGFESYFIDLMMKEMRKSIPKDDMTGGDSNQQEIFQDMSDQTLADTMSQRGDFGLAHMMYEQLSQALDRASTVEGAKTRNAAGQDSPETVEPSKGMALKSR